jgi:ubiquinone/menaquinone biosynthesis C-methylase UbiE
MLEFDDATARILEQSYLGKDFRRRRDASFAALAPRPGETLADIGCGNGLLTHDLGLAVGPTGKVTGIDPSDQMLALARARTEGMGQIELVNASAETLPLADGSLDGALSLQVFEYLDDPRPALAEAKRVLRPGGRLVLGDMHFGTLTWHSDDPDRMARMQSSWESHTAWTDLPAHLPKMLEDAGFAVTSVEPLTMLDTRLKPDGIARMMLILMARHAVAKGHLERDEVSAWSDEQDRLAAEGRFFFSLTHVVVTAHA